MALWKRMRIVCGALAFALLAACGGGGQDGEPSNAAAADGVTFDPPVLSLAFPEWDPVPGGQWLPVTAIVPNLGAASAYVLIVTEQRIFTNQPVEIMHKGGDRYGVLLPLRNFIPVGRYAGQITVRICYDPACNSQYAGSGATLPYELSVTPGIQLTVTVNGAVVSERPVQVRSGDIVSVQSSLVVQWQQSLGGASASDAATGSTTWSGTMRHDNPPPGPTGFLLLHAETQGNPVARASVSFLVER